MGLKIGNNSNLSYRSSRALGSSDLDGPPGGGCSLKDLSQVYQIRFAFNQKEEILKILKIRINRRDCLPLPKKKKESTEETIKNIFSFSSEI